MEHDRIHNNVVVAGWYVSRIHLSVEMVGSGVCIKMCEGYWGYYSKENQSDVTELTARRNNHGVLNRTDYPNTNCCLR